ncbi:MAG: acetyl-CoA acetyltransferase [Candidatus Lambdaproteobacteria bacterium RIFOXYD1_FULL_56_27]|uniref:Acetyl-CoA acetyltransferase n=1 Tax=Candidatus Lambdaproteobacteria bacterium RIFOXYD2_FULL_56_26 TaxID=1817773 RepID=A0A1F6GZM4_9PROT|nr:MAG: acetyl-CoA acetyltransferase [Candidatus Lambdaproteobacteria bacterium RIFOXYC1_FULL_56_13]OGH03607.1 MAG: acetyl-CoA acetyltransferase [Candidatus Lambdaproteobacteria bacterium RIFOXYD2_FULL_56_26]OGH06793.1 MAG: acetyl-CoA acetyltransferase [Candidatus Lambdaproteobacteria bacterium RIFOXYD1_FULL_56_27]
MVYYVDGLRTPFGAFNGGLKSQSAPELAAPLLAELVSRQGLRANSVDQVILGQVIQAGSGQAPARQATLRAGLDESVSAMTINKVCGSGLMALMLGAGAIRLGESGLVLAGGMESMSRAPHAILGAREGLKAGDSKLVDLLFWDALTDPASGRAMGELVEEKTKSAQISREAQDGYAIKSYQLALEAQKNGRLAKEILPVTLAAKSGPVTLSLDEEPGKVNFEKLPHLRPVFDPSGSITAANASSLNDGAAVCLLASETEVRARGLKPKAKILAYSSVSLKPQDFSLAPIPAIQRVLERGKVKISEVDFFEINEAFAAVPLMAIGALGLDPRRLNVNGGAVALGHPVGASGARLVITLVEQLVLTGAKYGVAALCIGGGESVAVLVQRAEG